MKKGLAYVLLVLFLVGVILLTYFKFFGSTNNVKKVPINSENSTLAYNKLDSITSSINNSARVKALLDKNVKVTAFRDNYSIVVKHSNIDSTVNYEFKYDDGLLSIVIDNGDEEFYRFKEVFLLVFEAKEKLLGNDSDLSNTINDFFDKNSSYSSITVDSDGDINRYEIDINSSLGEE